MQSAAVTGASGHIGANLIRALCAQERQVRALVHTDRRAFDGLDIEITPADVLDPDSLKKAFTQVEVVFHLAATISLRKRDAALMYRINVEGTRHVIEACRLAGVRRLVHFSSIHALRSDNPCECINEKTPLVERSRSLPYDWTKAAAENLVLDAVKDGLDAVIVNPTAVIGPHDYRPSHMGRFIISLYHRKTKALVKGGFNWVDVRDVTEGALLAESAGVCGERYLLGGTWLSLKSLSQLVQGVTGIRTTRFTFPMWLAHAGVPFVGTYSWVTGKSPLYSGQSLYALRHHKNISLQKAIEKLGYHPRPIRATIEDTYEWFLRKGYITPPV